MTVSEFIAKWGKVRLTERSAAQQHFLDLCEVFGHPKPADADPRGEWFTFEKGVSGSDGKAGWADVWKKGFFGWEYKGKHKDLTAAYNQLLRYREPLENPPLLVVCDMDRLVIHTNFTARPALVYDIPPAELGNPRNFEIVRNVFHDPARLEPGVTRQGITAEAASHLAEVAQAMRARGLDPLRVARFLDRVVFCLFAESVGLLPENVFSRIVEKSHREPPRFARLLGQLFEAMAHGNDFGMDAIRHFDGDLFADGIVLELTAAEIDSIHEATKRDWSEVDPSIFGTLFERGMDPGKRSQLGAHYTSREDIEAIVEPVIVRPLRREWEQVRHKVDGLLTKRKVVSAAAATRARKEAEGLLGGFLDRLGEVKVLDPACGSGNFLYVALQKLKDLEKEVAVYADAHGVGGLLPKVGPWQLYGIETNTYAFDLAQTTVWIGWLQWIRANGYGVVNDPILRPLHGFLCRDAVLDRSDPANPKEPEWPAVDFIVGNPPFLGNKRMRSELGEQYCEALWKLYGDRLPAMSDLCCYWFEKARAAIEAGRCKAAGLLATTAIRQVGGRRVLERVADSCKFFFAISDRDWVLDGAQVRICMVGFGPKGQPGPVTLDGVDVPAIHADLTSGQDLSSKRRLAANMGLCFMGVTKVGDFDIDHSQALQFLAEPNPHSRPNSDVLRPFRNGSDLVRVNSNRWIIDFGTEMSESEAALYALPFEHLVQHVRAGRQQNGRPTYRERWWIHGEARPGFRRAVQNQSRYLATARVAKHRIFVWLDAVVLPDSKVIAVALSDDFSFGVLQSRVHEVWTLANCGWHGIGNDATYNPTTCFETFPFPEATDDPRAAIAGAAAELDRLRSNWLNPAEWVREEVLEFPGALDGPWGRYVREANAQGIGRVRFPRLVPRDEECGRRLAKRTLTNLYNENPSWLRAAHRKLDEAVFAAYGWQPDMSEEALLAGLLALNQARAMARPD